MNVKALVGREQIRPGRGEASGAQAMGMSHEIALFRWKPGQLQSPYAARREPWTTSAGWQRDGAPPRTAQRVDVEKHEDVRFPSGEIRLAGTLITPITGTRHPAIILVHGSGPQNRESILPFARFLVRHGMAVLGSDKRGVGGSTGDWNTASYDDLAADVIAAFAYLKTRSDIDSGQIGLLGVSQAGWIMPLAAVRARDLAFLISISGAGIPGAETTIDQARNEMTALGMKPQIVDDIVALMMALDANSEFRGQAVNRESVPSGPGRES